MRKVILFILLMINGSLLLFAQQYPYYKELPQPRRIYEDIKDSDPLKTKARQSASFRLLGVIILRHSTARGDYDKFNAVESFFAKQYAQEEYKIKVEVERKLGSESRAFADWQRLQNDLTFSNGLEAELFRRYFSKQSEAQHRKIFAASLVEGKKIMAENAIQQQKEAADYQRKRELNRFTKQINAYWFIVYPLLIFSLIVIIRSAITRRGHIVISESDPNKLIVGSRVYNAVMITGEILTNKDKERTSYSSGYAISTSNTQHVHLRPLHGNTLIEEQFHNVGVDLVPGMTISYISAKYKHYNYLVYFKKHETNHEFYFKNANDLYGAKGKVTLAWLTLFSITYLIGVPFVTNIGYKELWSGYFAAIILLSIFIYAIKSSRIKAITNSYVENVVSKWRARADQEYAELRLLDYIRPEEK